MDTPIPKKIHVYRKYNIIFNMLNCKTKIHSTKDRRGYKRSLASCKNKSWIENDAWMKFEPINFCDIRWGVMKKISGGLMCYRGNIFWRQCHYYYDFNLQVKFWPNHNFFVIEICGCKVSSSSLCSPKIPSRFTGPWIFEKKIFIDRNKVRSTC